MIEALISTVAKVAKVNIRNDDDLVDRLNHRYTVIFLVIFTVIVSTTQYVGNPIHCWCPAYFTGNHEEYTNKVCWISNTYYLPERSIPNTPNVIKHHISYYQWVPIVLLVQAFFFYIPCIIWRIFSDRSGININNMVEAAETIQNALYPERRDKTIKYMIRHLDHYLDYQREYRGGCCSPLRIFLARFLSLTFGNRYGNYLVGVYMFVKTIYFSNAIVQLFLLSSFLGSDYHMYGLEVMRDLIQGHPVLPPSTFPRVTFCDFQVNMLNNVVHRKTLQCVLPINYFNEKIFAFLWFWFVLSSVATTLSFIRWVWVLGFRYTRTRYIQRHLRTMGKISLHSGRDRRLTRRFSELYLRIDGVFILKLVAKNSSDLVVGDIVASLWDHYKNKHVGSGQEQDLDDTESLE